MKFWKNMRIKIFLSKSNQNIDFNVKFLITQFIKTKRIKDLAQFLAVYCLQKNVIEDK